MGDLDKQFRNIRQELLKGLHGDVLDVGCATGLYLQYAMDKPVNSYTFLEPNPKMKPGLEQRVSFFQVDSFIIHAVDRGIEGQTAWIMCSTSYINKI